MSDRLVKINSVILKDVAQYALRKINSSNYICTISYALATPDLRHVRIGVETFPNTNSNLADVIKSLKQSQNDLQLKIARGHKLKTIPKITFERAVDHQVVDKIDSLLEEINHE